MRPVLVVEGVSKKFSKNQYLNRKIGFLDLFKFIFSTAQENKLRDDEFWAVRDVSFTLYPGESLALIGKNGSGKSTLLKILNGLLVPDAGKIVVNGSMRALINLGAGFDKNLTGAENIYNAGVLSGMSQTDIRQRYSDIESFADIGEFIDSPVGAYSSGMYARLGFAVAIHVNPAIILIDEILAVGDAAFQNKCFSKMHQLKAEGVTMVLVSHSHAQLSQFCNRAIWLNEGVVVQDGEAKEVLKEYIAYTESPENYRQIEDRRSNKLVPEDETTRAGLYGAIYDGKGNVEKLETKILSKGKETNFVELNSDFSLWYRFTLLQQVSELNVSINICREDGQLITTISTLNGDLLLHVNNGVVECRVSIFDLSLAPGNYVITMPIHDGHSYLFRDVVQSFKVLSADSLTWGINNFRYKYEVFC